MAPSSAVPPPSPQEVSRKLSLHSVAKKATAVSPSPQPSTPSALPPPQPQFSASSGGGGAESDSDTSDIIPANNPPLQSNQAISKQLLDSIAERNSVSDSESDDDHSAPQGNSSIPTFANPGDDIVLKSGYLWKKGERRKTWKKRWFVLRTHHLALYKNSAEYQLLRLVDLSQIHSATPVKLKRHDHAFGLVSPSRTFYLQASSDQDVLDWVHAIEAARNPGASVPVAIPRTPTAAEPPVVAVTPSPPSHSVLHHAAGVSSASESDDNAYAPTSSSRVSNTTSSPPSSRITGGSISASPAKSTITTATSATAASNTKDPSLPILQGYLMKCGSKRKIWRKRWFVLTNSALLYYSSHMDHKPHRKIPLLDVLDALEYDLPTHKHQSSPPTGPGGVPQPGSPTTPAPPSFSDQAGSEGGGGKYTFKIVCTKRALLLCAPAEEEEIKWLGAVRALIARRTHPGSPPLGAQGAEYDFPGDEVQPVAVAGVTSSALGRRRLSASGRPSNLDPTAEVVEE